MPPPKVTSDPRRHIDSNHHEHQPKTTTATDPVDFEATVESLSSELKSFGDVVSDRLKKLGDITKRIAKVRSSEAAVKKGRGRKKKEAGAPKIAKTAYRYYVDSRREALTKEGKKMTEISSICGEAWGKLDAAAKAPFEAQNLEDKARYAQEMEAFKATKATQQDEA